MPETAEQIAKEGREELEEVLTRMGLEHTVRIGAEAPEPNLHNFSLGYEIKVAGKVHTNSAPVSSSNVDRVFDFRKPLFKRLLGDLGLGLLEIIREERSGG
jgi:hypothetical protein